jgi:UDP-N-acetylglucosamine 2-epimerase (non-hydrolysing)/GDP/UDP-N,N'-diacetylbacillosamine 2-epimerase (hydrolysing)
MRKICVVTGTRAEYGLLSRLMRLIKESDQTELQIIATNMHLSPKYGNTYQEIEKDGFVIDKKIPILNEEKDDANATIKSMAKALSGFADAYDELKPDLVVVLGDRYEILAAATAALIECIPIAHIHGGEITEGAYDDAIRHSITKMSHLHFTSTEEYRRRVIQLGEQPERVFYVGALGVENITSIPLMAKEEVEESIGFMIDRNTILVTYHPVTLSRVDVKTLIKDFLSALQERTNLRIVFTMPNSDNGGSIISKEIEQFVARNNDRAICFKSLGIKRYLSLMKQVSAVVGNSSSGILEAPSFRIPTLNIGDRQTGRVAAESVYNCAPDKVSILTGLDFIFSDAFKEKAAQAVNPYDKSGTAEAIFNVIKSYPLNQLEHKHFFDIPQ